MRWRRGERMTSIRVRVIDETKQLINLEDLTPNGLCQAIEECKHLEENLRDALDHYEE